MCCGAPCIIYSDEEISNSNNNYGFKILIYIKFVPKIDDFQIPLNYFP